MCLPCNTHVAVVADTLVVIAMHKPSPNIHLDCIADCLLNVRSVELQTPCRLDFDKRHCSFFMAIKGQRNSVSKFIIQAGLAIPPLPLWWLPWLLLNVCGDVMLICILMMTSPACQGCKVCCHLHISRNSLHHQASEQEPPSIKAARASCTSYSSSSICAMMVTL